MANIKIYFLLTILVGVSTQAQTTISMNSYLEQVKEKDPAYKASLEILQGARMRSAESDLLVLPTLGAQISHNEDKSPLQPTILYGTERTTNSYQLYISEQTRFGLDAKLAYGENYYSTLGSDVAGFVPAGPAPLTTYYTASPSIQLTQSLWRNGFGSETRAHELSLQAKAMEIYYNNRSKNIGVLIDAQMAYYRLYYAKKTVAAVKSSLNVAKKLLDWAKNRLSKGLGEKTDYLQTKAAYELRQLDLLSAEEEVRSASRSYNSLREIDSNTVSEVLQDPGLPEYQGPTQFSDKKWRDDVRASEKNLQSAKATALLGKEKNKPNLDLLGSYGLNSLDAGAAQARNDSFRTTYPTWMIGIKFSTPLAFGKASNVREGYEKEAYGADQDFRRKAEEQLRDYNDLQSKVANAYSRLALSKTLEQSQKIKAELERARHQHGRTTFFEVLQFEQDYLTSELSCIKTESELSGYLLQLQKYREE